VALRDSSSDDSGAEEGDDEQAEHERVEKEEKEKKKKKKEKKSKVGSCISVTFAFGLVLTSLCMCTQPIGIARGCASHNGHVRVRTLRQ
jgi:hypothetical protein